MTGLDPQHETLSISVVIVAELLAGMRKDEQQPTGNLLSLFEKIPISETIECSAGGHSPAVPQKSFVGTRYALIAATALAANATLIT
jgi:predicted nucleic acid-binding protein